MIKSKKRRNIILLALILIGIGLVPAIQNHNRKINMEEFFASPRWSKLKLSYENHPIVNDCSLLFGDSMTENFKEFIASDWILNFGISGDFSIGLINRVNGVVRQQPKQIFIMIGINDLIEKIPISSVKNNYDNLLKQLLEECPNSEIFVQSTLPTRGIDSFFSSSKKTNNKVLELNQKMRATCFELGISFIDLYPLFADGANLLKESYSLDGIHLNKEGYILWKNTIQKYISFSLG